MVRSAVAVTLLLLMVSMPTGHAQDDSEYVLLGEDPEGDIDGEATSNPWNPMDLTALELKENPEGFHFRVSVRGLEVDVPPTNQASDEPIVGVGDQIARNVYYRLYFTVNEVDYMVYFSYVDDPEYLYGYLAREDAQYGFLSYLRELTIGLDEDLPGFTFTLKHDDLLDDRGVQPRPGDKLTDLRMYSGSTGSALLAASTEGMAMKSNDYLPDTGVLDVTWEVQQGVVSQGHIIAWSDLPVRVSNGEATTFLYEVQVTNEADYRDIVIPDWTGGNDNWAVTFPGGKIRLDAGESRTIPFLVTVPFAHEHGKYYPFTVEFQSQADPLAKGLVELGVRYTAIPQPAGHHPEVFMHGSGYQGYFNTIKGEEYPDGAEETGSNSGFSCSGSNSAGSYRSYLYPLSPALEMGLDFDLEAEGEANIIVHSDYPTTGYSIEAFFVVDDQRPSVCRGSSAGHPEGTVAIVERTDPIELGMDETKTITTSIRATEYGDYLEFRPGMQMWMIYVLWSSESTNVPITIGGLEGGAGIPAWQPDSSFFLPINEYHDDVNEFFNQFNGVDLFPITPQQRLVNPGEVTVFRVEATNIGLQRTTVNIELTGANTAWATLLGPSSLKLAPGETRELAMAVRAAPDAVDGELADITLHVTDSEDESVRSLIRLLAEVDTDADHPDESDQVMLLDEELQRAPAPFLPLLVALAATLLVMRRRMA